MLRGAGLASGLSASRPALCPSGEALPVSLFSLIVIVWLLSLGLGRGKWGAVDKALWVPSVTSEIRSGQ